MLSDFALEWTGHIQANRFRWLWQHCLDSRKYTGPLSVRAVFDKLKIMFRIKCKNTASNHMQIAIGVSQMTSYQYQAILLSHFSRVRLCVTPLTAAHKAPLSREQSPAFLRNSNGRLDFPGPTQEASWMPRRNSRILLHLEKNHVVPPSSQDVALCRYSVSGEVPL